VRRTGYAQIDGLSIAYQVHGDGAPLIFQPGYMTNIDQNSALAGPGEVLVSSTVKDLVIGSGTRFSDRGIHTLKGVPDDWHLFLVER